MPLQAVLGFSVDDGWEKAMSPAIAFGLIFASFFVFGQPYFQLSKWANDVAGVIAIGVMDGVPISTKHRAMLLYGVWGAYVTMAVGCAVFCAVVNMSIANYVTDAGVKLVAYLTAFIAATAALAWVANGLWYYRSLLREVERS